MLEQPRKLLGSQLSRCKGWVEAELQGPWFVWASSALVAGLAASLVATLVHGQWPRSPRGLPLADAAVCVLAGAIFSIPFHGSSRRLAMWIDRHWLPSAAVLLVIGAALVALAVVPFVSARPAREVPVTHAMVFALAGAVLAVLVHRAEPEPEWPDAAKQRLRLREHLPEIGVSFLAVVVAAMHGGGVPAPRGLLLVDNLTLVLLGVGVVPWVLKAGSLDGLGVSVLAVLAAIAHNWVGLFRSDYPTMVLVVLAIAPWVAHRIKVWKYKPPWGGEISVEFDQACAALETLGAERLLPEERTALERVGVESTGEGLDTPGGVMSRVPGIEYPYPGWMLEARPETATDWLVWLCDVIEGTLRWYAQTAGPAGRSQAARPIHLLINELLTERGSRREASAVMRLLGMGARARWYGARVAPGVKELIIGGAPSVIGRLHRLLNTLPTKAHDD